MNAREQREIVVILSPRKIAALGLGVVFAIILMYVATQGMKFYGGHDRMLGFTHQFDLFDENNIPTWYSSSLLLFCSALLALIWIWTVRVGERYAVHWLGLSIVLLFLSLDEAASFHESLSDPVREAFHATGYLYFAWVIPGVLFVLVLGISFVRFLVYLPGTIRRLFVLSGVTFFGGALIPEMWEANYFYSFGTTRDTVPFSLMVMIEEGAEMLGAVFFVYALCSYLANYAPVRLVFHQEA
jgi:hypothetical protein